MSRRLLTLLVVAVLAAAGVTTVQERSGGDDPPAGGGAYDARVDHVVDGDTLVVRRGGARVTVRLVQVDAPESSSSRYGRPDACGAAATRFAQGLTRPGDTVRVVPAGRDATDRYGRVLAIVRLPGGGTWQQRIVAAGWAEPYVVGGNETRILPALRRAADRARAARRGVWGRCGGDFHTAA